MTRLLLMHSIAIITALCLLATPTEAPFLGPWAEPDLITAPRQKYSRPYVRQRNVLIRKIQTIIQKTKKKLKDRKVQSLTCPASSIHVLEGDVLHNYLDGFNLWWRGAVHPGVVDYEISRRENVELVKNALRPIVHEDNNYSPDIAKRRVRWLLYNLEGGSEEEAKSQMCAIFLLNFRQAGKFLLHRLSECRKTHRKEDFPYVSIEITGWEDMMRQLTIGAFTYDLRRVKNCSVDVWNPQYLSFSSMATYIASDAFNCVKDYLKSDQSEADYKEFEFRLEVFALLGQIEEQWYKIHNLSIACYNTPE